MNELKTGSYFKMKYTDFVGIYCILMLLKVFSCSNSTVFSMSGFFLSKGKGSPVEVYES
jgi:hypothetical protein